MAASTPNEFYLRPFPCFDKKWLRANLPAALRSTDVLSVLWNNLVKDGEVVCVSPTNTITTAVNSAGHVAFMQTNGKYHCGVEKLACKCCKGSVCLPSKCNCEACQLLDAREGTTKRIGGAGVTSDGGGDGFEPNELLTSDSILESWLWNHCPSKLKDRCNWYTRDLRIFF